MRVVTNNDIKEMNRLYLELKTYAAVARATGFSPATVKKYIVKDYTVIDESQIQRFDRPLPEFDSTIFRTNDWGPLCELSQEEMLELQKLWNELEV